MALLSVLLSWSVGVADELEVPVAEPDPIVDPAPEKHYLRTAILEALALGGGTAWYWLDRERQVADWDFPSLAERMTLDVIRYDNNPHHVNFAWHAANGMSFHFMARINGLSFLESVAAGSLTSLAWEYALEYREKVSFNDLIFTTGAGIPLGEFMHVLGRYLNEDPEAAEISAARWTLGLPAAVMRSLDGRLATSEQTRPDFWHDLHLAYDFSTARATVDDDSARHQLHGFHMDGRFVRLKGYGRPGTFRRFFTSAEFTEAAAGLAFGGQGDSMRLSADTTLLGWYGQQIYEAPERLSSQAMLGVSLAYLYRRDKVGFWDDQVGVFHFPGLAADLNLHWQDFSLEARTRVHADFVGINALSNEDWEAAHPGEQGKAILRKQGYYYGFGASAAISATLRYRNIALGGRLWGARYYSDEGLDRTQEMVTLDQKSNDRFFDSELWLRVEGLPYHSYLGASFVRRDRQAQLEEFTASAELSRLTLNLGLAL